MNVKVSVSVAGSLSVEVLITSCLLHELFAQNTLLKKLTVAV